MQVSKLILAISVCPAAARRSEGLVVDTCVTASHSYLIDILKIVCKGMCACGGGWGCNVPLCVIQI